MKATTDFSVPNVGGWKKGEEVNVDETLAQVLLSRGLTEEVKKETPKEEKHKEESKLKETK